MKLVSFEGRTDRQHFFAMLVLLYLIGLLFTVPAGTGGLALVNSSAIDLPVKDIAEALPKLPLYVAWTLLVVGLLGLALVILALIAIAVRRLHDFGMTGLVLLFLPMSQAVTAYMQWPDFLIKPPYLFWTIILIVVPGTRGSNAFGPDPRQIRA